MHDCDFELLNLQEMKQVNFFCHFMQSIYASCHNLMTSCLFHEQGLALGAMQLSCTKNSLNKSVREKRNFELGLSWMMRFVRKAKFAVFIISSTHESK